MCSTQLPAFVGDPEGLRRRVAELLGSVRVTLQIATGGASRVGLVVLDVAGDPIAFLRLDDGGSGISGTDYDLPREAALLRRLSETGLPVPAVLGELTSPPATLLEFIPGESRVPEDDAERVASQYMGYLAAVHRVPPSIGGERVPATTTEAVRADLEWWFERIAGDGTDRDPLIGLAARMLDEMQPQVHNPPTFLHGDAGPGNFLVDRGVITALLDWEMAHLGDRHEDVAWVWIRGVHTPFGSMELRLQEFEYASGEPIDTTRLRWSVVLVLFKSVTAMATSMQRGGSGRLAYVQFTLLLAYRAILAASLGALVGSDARLLTMTPVVEDTERSRIIERLSELVPDAPREHTLIAEYLIERERMDSWERQQRAQDEKLLGFREADLASASAQMPLDEVAPLLGALTRIQDRALYAHPHAVRRVRSAQAIGLVR